MRSESITCGGSIRVIVISVAIKQKQDIANGIAAFMNTMGHMLLDSDNDYHVTDGIRQRA